MKQITFSNEEEEIRSRLIEAAFWVRGKSKQFLDRFGLTQQQYQVLKIVERCDRELEYSTKEISDRMIDRFADTSRVVDRLVKKGLLIKKTCNNDKRLVRISLAPKGESHLGLIQSKIGELDSLTQKLDHNEKDMLIYILSKLIQ